MYYENPTKSQTIPITSRGTTDLDRIVDAKLQQFFLVMQTNLNKEKIQTPINQQRKTLADVEYLDLDSIAKIL